MDKKKVSFIIFDDNGMGIDSAIKYLNALDVPEGISVEIINSEKKCTRFEMYNAAMGQSSAKYKVYMDDSLVILQKTFIKDILDIFNDDNVGAIGCQGTDQLSTTGIIEKSANFFGRSLSITGEKNVGKMFEDSCKNVQILSGGVFVTQYDLPWREDIFTGDSYWQESQSVEFCRAGYRCVVPRQDDFWLLKNKIDKIYDDTSIELFLREYSHDIYPLVSIVIPTYNRPHYLEIALESVINQTYRNLDIFISDDSDDAETAKMIKEKFSNDKRIRYEHHPEFTLHDNWDNVINYNNPHAEYVNWLMDDDVFDINKIQIMMEAFLQHENLTLVTSYRKLIDKNGDLLPDADFNARMFAKDTIIRGQEAGKMILQSEKNFIGELTTVLIKKEYMSDGKICGVGTKGEYRHADFPTYLDLLSKGDMMYISSPLSFFRFHDGQHTWTLFNTCNGRICWAVQIMEAIKRRTFFTSQEEQRVAILYWLLECTYCLKNNISTAEWDDCDVKNLLMVYQCMAKGLIDPCEINFEIVGNRIEI